jgi:hypothetical protein
MKKSPKGRSRKPTQSKKVKPKGVARSDRVMEATRNVSNTLEDGFISAFKRIVQRIAQIKTRDS